MTVFFGFSTELMNSVREELLHFFQRNKRQAGRERAKVVTLYTPQLKNCKNHFDKKRKNGKGMIVFICEGQSAAAITSYREAKIRSWVTMYPAHPAPSRHPAIPPPVNYDLDLQSGLRLTGY